jgi:hypothetical protein
MTYIWSGCLPTVNLCNATVGWRNVHANCLDINSNFIEIRSVVFKMKRVGIQKNAVFHSGLFYGICGKILLELLSCPRMLLNERALCITSTNRKIEMVVIWLFPYIRGDKCGRTPGCVEARKHKKEQECVGDNCKSNDGEKNKPLTCSGAKL